MAEILKKGFYVEIAAKFYKIVNIEPFQYTTGEETTAHFSSVSIGSDSGWVNITTLEPDDNPPRLFQVLFGVNDGCRYYFKIPSGNNRFGVDEDKDIGYIDNEISPANEPNDLYEFWLINNYYPSIKATNITDATLIPRVFFRGMKYDIEEIKAGTVIYDNLAMGRTNYRQITLGGVRVS